MSIPHLNDVIRKDFIQFLNLKDRQITVNTQKRYLSDIQYYVDNYIETSLLINNFELFFNFQAVKNFLSKRRSSTARATLRNFLECLFTNKYIDATLHFEIQEFLKSLKKTKLEQQMVFLNESQLSFIFSDLIRFKDKESDANHLLPLILSLSYNCLFEQEHLMKLKWSDIDLNRKKIRNLRSDLDESIVKWIEMDERTYRLINIYKDHYKTKISETDSFLYINGHPANNKTINAMLQIFKHKANLDILKTTIDIQRLYRSRMLIDLLQSEGRVAIDFIKIVGLKRNTQLEHALEEYLMYEYSKKLLDL
ncbi:hypothetical protein J7E73_08410 [Paenibacillus albidus]|uniref:hypothetical protein n=1 Tax=Paenibacillus albidus TaxID=2041023 RepID=UPI001BE958B7|nr:hypothetical protein [Paenibacillus albidus]MBT2289154.1 hypothetical protein [Paenibacillus albidus]